MSLLLLFRAKPTMRSNQLKKVPKNARASWSATDGAGRYSVVLVLVVYPRAHWCNGAHAFSAHSPDVEIIYWQFWTSLHVQLQWIFANSCNVGWKVFSDYFRWNAKVSYSAVEHWSILDTHSLIVEVGKYLFGLLLCK